MNKKEQRKYDERRLEVLEKDYNNIKGLADALRNDIYDLTLEWRVPDARERQLMTGRRYALESLQENIRETIVFLRNRIKANKPEPWEEPDNGIKDWSQFKKTDSIYIGVDVSNEGDRAYCQVWGDNTTAQHHCGQDAKEEAHVSLNELLGMEIISYGGKAMKCEGCSWDCGNCVKVELVGGDYICLAKPQQEESTTEIDDSPKSFEEAYRDSMNLLREFCIEQSEANQRLVKALKEESEELKKPFINFEDDDKEGLGDIMKRIKEDTQVFMDYLESITNTKENE